MYFELNYKKNVVKVRECNTWLTQGNTWELLLFLMVGSALSFGEYSNFLTLGNKQVQGRWDQALLSSAHWQNKKQWAHVEI